MREVSNYTAHDRSIVKPQEETLLEQFQSSKNLHEREHNIGNLILDEEIQRSRSKPRNKTILQG